MPESALRPCGGGAGDRLPGGGRAPLSVSVVVPVLDGRRYLERSLPALLALRDPRPAEVIVVDDGSSDGSERLARELGARTLGSGGRALGPARARNVGIEAARGEVVLFVDADVVVHTDVLTRVVAALEDPAIAAVFGSYDDEPPQRGFASQYMNLRHHHIHQQQADDAPTFWAGLGAVRRSALLEVGGFDAHAFRRPSVEDIELALRLRAAGGRIRRVPAIQGTHLKRWSLGEVIRTDFLRRALPWSELMLRHPGAFGDLNVAAAERGKAALALVLATALIATAAGWLPWWAPLALLAAAVAANARLLGLFARRNGLFFALRALLFHQLYYLYSSTAYALSLLRGGRRRKAARATPSGTGS